MIVIALAVLLGGCSLHPQGLLLGAPANLGPLQYFEWTQRATAAELAAERSRLDAAGSGDPLVGAVQRALLLSSGEGVNATRRRQALTLLDDTAGLQAARAQDRDYRTLADLLRATWTQPPPRQAAAAPVPAPAPAPAADNAAELESLRETNRQLQEKIDALTGIERQLIERELQTQP